LTQFEEFPRFMEGVHSVRQLDDAHLHWRAEKGGREMEWDAEITEQIPDRCIAWRNTSGPKNEGKVALQPIEPDKTRITLSMEAEEDILKHPEAQGESTPQPDQDLARFKKMIESQGQESGAWRGEIRQGQRVDLLEEDASHSMGASVVGKTTDQALSEAAQTPGASDTFTQSAKSMQQDVGEPGAFAPAGQSATAMPVTPSQQLAESLERQVHAVQQTLSSQPWVPNFFHAWEEPFSLMRRMSEEMDQFFERWLIGPTNRWGQRHAIGPVREWTPPVEISEHDNQLVICAELPGIKKEDVQVEITSDQVTIEGERRTDSHQAQQACRHSERNYGHFYRAIALPDGVDPDAARASMHDGLLEITLPVPPNQPRVRRVDIQHVTR
jgi:HSP20 family molecular chaperone IbpA